MSLTEKLHKLWHGETRGLTAAAVILGIASIASSIVGVLRDHTLAATFGAGPALDAYYAAFRVPDFLYTLIIMGALSTGFIPVFSEYLETKSKDEAWKLAAQTLSTVGAFMAVACLILAACAQWLVPLTVPGFSPDNLALTIGLSRIMFLSPFLLGLSAVMGGILQATRRFLAFSLAPIFYNLGIIGGALFLAPRMGITGVAWGVVIGAFLHFLVQAMVAIKLGLPKLPKPSFKHEGVRRIIKLMVPRTMGLAVSQFNMVILLVFASAMTVGSVAVFNLANNLQQFPVGIFGTSFALAAFPVLSAYASLKDQKNFKREMCSAANKIMFLMVPSTAGYFLLRAQIVRLVLGAGQFDWNDTIRTANVLGMFTISLIGQALIPLWARAFYAMQNTRTPFWISVVSEGTMFVLAWTLRQPLGVMGLALAFALATYVNLSLMWFFFRRKYGSLDEAKMARSLGKTVLASLAILAVGYPVRQLVGTLFHLRTFWEVALQAGATMFVGVGIFILASWLLKSPELFQVVRALRRKFFREKVAVAIAEESEGM